MGAYTNSKTDFNKLLQSKSPKKWARAYFNHGLINYMYGQKDRFPVKWERTVSS